MTDSPSVVCKNCGQPAWHERAHYVPGNWIIPAGWACPPQPTEIEMNPMEKLIAEHEQDAKRFEEDYKLRRSYNGPDPDPEGTAHASLMARVHRAVAKQIRSAMRKETDLLNMATEFTVGVSRTGPIRVQSRGHRWAIVNGGSIYSRDGTWEYEPLPSNREDDFLDRCRYERDEAIHIARTLVE